VQKAHNANLPLMVGTKCAAVYASSMAAEAVPEHYCLIDNQGLLEPFLFGALPSGSGTASTPGDAGGAVLL
jgi:hypothetical protein